MRVLLCCDYPKTRIKLAERLAEHDIECVTENEDAVLAIPRTGNVSAKIAERAAHDGTGLVVVVKKENLAATESCLEGSGATVLSDDLPFAAIVAALKAAAKTGERLVAVREEVRHLHEKLDDERTVTRAKLLLMERRGLTESQAHRHIEKAAMDERMTRRDVALEIIAQYGADARQKG